MPTATSPIDASSRTREPLAARSSASGAPTGGSGGHGGFCGLLLDPAADPWGDAGLLGFPAGADDTTPPAPQSLRDFIAAAYPRYGFHRWAELLIERLQAVADGELSRLIVTCPPRLGKSLLVSKLFPAYFIQRHPQLFCAIASYSAELAYAHSREARHYYRLTGNPLSKDSAAVGNWLTPERGGCIAAGVNGPFTGKGYSLGIIDDPYKGPADASSRVIRERLIDWLRSVWLTRAEPAEVADEAGTIQRNLSAQVIVLTRWDHQDVVAWLLEQELGEAPQHWHVLDLPAIAEPMRDRPRFPATCKLVPDWRKPGEALCPERFPLPELLKIRTRLGSYWWNALYQQRPSPAEGLLFRKGWIQPPLPAVPGRPKRYAPLVLSCDLSFKDGKDNDHCGFCLLGLLEPERSPLQEARRRGLVLATNAGKAHRPGQLTTEGATAPDPWAELQIEVLWAHRQQLDLPGVIRFLLASLGSLERQGLRPDAVLIEDAANGPAVCQLLRRQVPGLIAIPPKGSKASRAHAVAPLVEAGQVRFHRRSDSLIEEMLAFSPRGGIDDQVDAFCQGVLWIEQRFWRGRGSSQAPVPMVFSR
jgi:predicted phage terminase large subunit-like protein